MMIKFFMSMLGAIVAQTRKSIFLRQYSGEWQSKLSIILHPSNKRKLFGIWFISHFHDIYGPSIWQSEITSNDSYTPEGSLDQETLPGAIKPSGLEGLCFITATKTNSNVPWWFFGTTHHLLEVQKTPLRIGSLGFGVSGWFCPWNDVKAFCFVWETNSLAKWGNIRTPPFSRRNSSSEVTLGCVCACRVAFRISKRKWESPS